MCGCAENAVAVPNGAPPEALANGPVADDSMAVEDSDAGEGGDDEAALEGPTLGERLAELGILPPEVGCAIEFRSALVRLSSPCS